MNTMNANKQICDRYWQGDRCQAKFAQRDIVSNNISPPYYSQKDGKITITQTIKVPEEFQTSLTQFIIDGLQCNDKGQALDSELHQCMKESYHLPYRWESKFTTENVDGNYLFYSNSVCLIPGDAAILRYTLKLEHPNRVKEIGEGVCEGYKIMIQTREELRQYGGGASLVDIGACNRYKLICSKDGLGKEAEPYAEDHCGSPEFQHKGHEYVYDCFKHEIITDKTVGSCYWDCAGGAEL